MALTAADMRARVLYRDDHVLVIDKPYGLPVHYGTKTTDHLELYLPHLTDDRDEPPRLAHRLDKDTAGCLVLARDAAAAARIGDLFLAGKVAKTYWAVVEGRPKGDTGSIDMPLLKVRIPGTSKVVVDLAGKPALTDWRLLASHGGLSWLELHPRTGRMHQIRAHCAYMGMPLLGDPIYGAQMPPQTGLHLLARAVQFNFSAEAPVSAVAEPPPHMAQTLAKIVKG
ncbi:RNA pseudouridine synthase [Niveispirillum sp. BGYR6]|uniref:RluA family pseudouridine synthase n=1 Tax=Niveispirillum sp. BGYR6 TaxID=2971249 RepID=UPI0022B9CD0C|nr:RNA pseudouridine synthase [Niveispirillum sp. BGYR6]MDG5494421.1 RNA pseudouridine synthase [Niveispirillum sp. BGYR6]